MNEPVKSEKVGWLWRGLAVVALVIVATLLVRYRLIEPMNIASLCERDDAPGWCWLRKAFVFLFAQKPYPAAAAAIVFGVWSTIARSRTLAFAALSFGFVGMLLYRFDAAVLGVLLAALVIAREAAGRPEDAERRRA
jgi:hypothetical protein